MKQNKKKNLMIPVLAALLTMVLSVPAYAAELAGALTDVNGTHITGWAWNKDVTDETVDVEIHIYKDGAEEAAKTVTIQADAYSDESQTSAGSGNHAFDYTVNWAELGGSTFRVEAYAVSGETKTLLSDSKEYKPAIIAGSSKLKSSSSGEVGPGIAKEEPVEEQPAAEPSTKKGESLGVFTTTAYCSCRRCSGGSGRTYSGTIPQASHTISADLSILPLGTKVMIGDTVYTVEDKGSGVDGKIIDIYYGSHGEALNHGRKKQEVFAVITE